MHNIMVAGIGTEVGKTLVSAILTALFKGDYWKPISCGSDNGDSEIIRQWVDTREHTIHPSIYSLNASLSPHHAARLENTVIDLDAVILPQTTRPLIIEGVGGVCVPLTLQKTTLDLFASWPCQWVIVSRHYLGSINHTLLTLEMLKQRGVRILGLIFNGEPNPDTESAIMEMGQVPLLGRLLPEPNFNRDTVINYTTQWQNLKE